MTLRCGGGRYSSTAQPLPAVCSWVDSRAWKRSIRRFVITEKAPTRAFSWLKAPSSAFTFKTLLRHYAKQALTPRSLNVKLGPRRNYHKGRAAIRHNANQPARPLWLKCESATRRFQPGPGPSRGLLRDCRIFANLRLTFVSSSMHYVQI